MNREFVLVTPHGPLRGELTIPSAPRGLVVLAHVHDSPEDVGIASDLAAGSLSVLSMPLLTEEEMRFPDAAHNVPLLTQRLVDLLNLIRIDGDTESLPMALYAGGPATPAALRAAALRDAQVRVLTCHGGLIDQAGLQSLDLLAAPLLMLADADDAAAEASFQRAAEYICAPHKFVCLYPGESPGSHVARWFEEHLQAI